MNITLKTAKSCKKKKKRQEYANMVFLLILILKELCFELHESVKFIVLSLILKKL